MRHGESIAIVGYGGVFPGAQGVEGFWRIVRDGLDSTSDVPPGRWLLCPERAYDPGGPRRDRVSTLRGGFVGCVQLKQREGRSQDFGGGRLDPLFDLVLLAAQQAWSGTRSEGIDRSKVGVILGNIVLPTESSSAFSRKLLGRAIAEQLGVPWSEDGEVDPLNAFPAAMPAALVAQELELGGPAFTLDAACASSLFAIKIAVDLLSTGSLDAVLTGGVSRPDSLYTQMGFSQLRALSPRGRAAPFDAQADGLIVGEGAGLFVLKRLSDALAQGDEIHAVIRGLGLSNDLHGDLLAPSTEGQLRAMKAAYDQAGWSPREVDLIECHATGTPVGDAVEIESLKALWRLEEGGLRPGQCVLGSVKANVGHLLTAAGAAGLVKVLLSLRNRTFPPTANFHQPHPALASSDSPFRVLTTAEVWPAPPSGRPRRAAISGFGFGGINAHLLIEEWTTPGSEPRQDPVDLAPSRVRAAPEPIAIVGMAAHFAGYSGLVEFQQGVLGEPKSPETNDPGRWWRICEPHWSQTSHLAPLVAPRRLGPFDLELGQFRIPPRELLEMLPQQSLMLKVAADALAHSRWKGDGIHAGVIIGLGLDQNSNHFELRWWITEHAPEWNQKLRWGLSPRALDDWVEEVCDAVAPPLTATRTMGSLGSLVASRIAREFRFGGPSFSVSCDEGSGLQALAIAADWLARRELELAIVGAVDFAADLRSVWAYRELRSLNQRSELSGSGGQTNRYPPLAASEGAAALVLKRLDAALREGDQIYAVVEDVVSLTDHSLLPSTLNPTIRAAIPSAIQGNAKAPRSLRVLREQHHWSGVVATPPSDQGRGKEVTASDPPAEVVCCLQTRIGWTGAAGGLASVARAALCLEQRILPDDSLDSNSQRPDPVAALPPTWGIRGPCYWLTNRDERPRQAVVECLGKGGQFHLVRLRSWEEATSSSSSQGADRFPPLGAPGVALFVVEANSMDELTLRLDERMIWVRQRSERTIDHLARLWWREFKTDSSRPLGLAVVSRDVESLVRMLEQCRDQLKKGAYLDPDAQQAAGATLFPPREFGSGSPGVAFVYPGLGNAFPGMGRALSARWAGVLRAQESRNGRLRDQFASQLWWESAAQASPDDHRPAILGQIAVGTLVTDILRQFGVPIHAAVGYSMGETAALVSTGTWPARDEMADRLLNSPLFSSKLAGPRTAARGVWGLREDEAVEWVAAIVPRPSEAVDQLIAGRSRVYVLIRNDAEETVIGGCRPDVMAIASELGTPLLELPCVSTVHCEIGRVVEDEYRALHDLPTETPDGIRFYSGVWGRSYRPTRELAREAISAQAAGRIDFPAVVESAYSDGIRVFIEVGPGGSCTRLIRRILRRRPHLARSAHPADRDPVEAILEVLGALVACRVGIDLEPLYGRPSGLGDGALTSDSEKSTRFLTIDQSDGPMQLPLPPNRGVHEDPTRAGNPKSPTPGAPLSNPRVNEDPKRGDRLRFEPEFLADLDAPRGGAAGVMEDSVVGTGGNMESTFAAPSTDPSNAPVGSIASPVTGQMLAALEARGKAHGSFLRVSAGYAELIGRNLGFQLQLLESSRFDADLSKRSQSSLTSSQAPSSPEPPRSPERTVVLDRDQCLEFAVGSIARVLGEEFAAIDSHPTRVRLPDEPLMLVDRVVRLEGTPRSLDSGRVVTEHDVRPGAWYLDAGRMPACVAIEAGQADLFLSAFLGIDFQTQGRATYRLLDATVTFHRDLPRPGDVVRYDIRITRFFRQGGTHLFRFEFDGTIGGEPLLTMRDGCAGFFSAEELRAGKGIVLSSRGEALRKARTPQQRREFLPPEVVAMDERQVELLRAGDLAGAFGAPFDRLNLAAPLRLPAGRLSLIHRVPTIDPHGGPWGLGLIRAEADIHPDDWFIVCHFVDDRVMPGTLMYECCLQTLRVFLMRQGWLGEEGQVAFQPLPGIANRLRCRGQVIESTRLVTYEVAIKEMGDDPEPYAIADALIYADGKPIVEITDLALRLSGTDRDRLARLWDSATSSGGGATSPSQAGDRPTPKPDPPRSEWVCGKDQILEFATGSPSACFGAKYRPFDEGRFIARLPRPPYLFLDRILEAQGKPWVMAEGVRVCSEFDVAPDAWYFESARQPEIPFAVLLETALQTCGWTSAFMGSALQSEEDLKFRNLGGTARQLAPIPRDFLTLRTEVMVTRVVRSAGMILHQYDFSVRLGDQVVYQGNTDFGFFHPTVLEEQVGIRELEPYRPTEAERGRSRCFRMPSTAGFPDERWRMLDRIDQLILDGGPAGCGFIAGSKTVCAHDWFFGAHFLDDPVWPGSLGLESLVQLLRVFATERWKPVPGVVLRVPDGELNHRWLYRGQVLPTNREVVTQAQILEIDDDRQWLRANGLLLVDDKVIYRMTDFALRAHSNNRSEG
jgi:acyl transferase domain-containing protein/3-hydroxymyristoyl/3-hydroxydecanoyl-(acyl carrier protein) dehydratase